MFSVRNNARLKWILVVTVSIVAFLSLFTIAFQWYFNPARLPKESDEEVIKKLIAGLEDNNAAKYYLEACLSLAPLPDDDLLWARFMNVVENGWQEDDPELEDFISKNEVAMDMVRKGNRQEFCLMPEEGPAEEDITYLGGFRHIGRLFVVKAKLFENKGEYDRAGETYADMLLFARNVSDSGTVIQALVGMAIEGMAYDAADSYLIALNDKDVCKKLLDKLIEIEAGRASPNDMLEREFANRKRVYSDRARGILYFKFPVENPTIPDLFLDTVRRVGGYLSFRFCMLRWEKTSETFSQIFLEESRKSYPEFSRSRLEDKIPKDEVTQIRFESLRKIILALTTADVDRRANIIKTALRLHLLENGEYPETLDELVPIVPENILTDPFSEKRFIYRRTGTGYLLYSVGPDMDDDGGKRIEGARSPESDGDIVFEPAES